MKNYRFFALLCMLGVLLTSCNKKNEWTNYYGYTCQDIAGSYGPSNVSTAFEGLTESDLCHICNDAQVEITSNGSKITLNFKSVKAGLEKSWNGNPIMNENDFLLQMGNIAGEVPEILATVYIDQSRHVRLHGYVRKVKSYTPEGPVYINNYFDVIRN